MSEIRGYRQSINFEDTRYVNLMFKNSKLSMKTLKSSISSYLIISIILLASSIVLFSTNSIDQLFIEIKYYDSENAQSDCQIGTVCSHNFTLSQAYINQTIYIYYRIDDFTQKQNGYMRSFNRRQLAGIQISQRTANYSCQQSYVTNAQISKTISQGAKQLDPEAIANPCGLIASNLFIDTFQLISHVNEPTEITIQSDFIFWEGYRNIYKDSENAATNQWRTHNSARFISWMSAKGLPNTKILWGFLSNGLEAGNYQIKVKNQYNSSLWTGSRYLHIQNEGFNAGRLKLMPAMLLIFSFFCFLFAMFFCIKMRNFQKEDL